MHDKEALQKSLGFFIQNNMIERITVPVAKYAHNHGIALEDRSSTSQLNIDDCGINWNNYNPVMIYGSVQFLRKARKSSLERYVLYDEYSFSSETWQKAFGNELLNHDGTIIQVKDISINDQMHIRPLNEDKAFNAKVFDRASWNSVLHDKDRNISPELLCWVSDVKHIQGEWRCWFVGNELIDFSQYRDNNNMKVIHDIPADVAAYAKEMAQTWLPKQCVVMDIAKTDKGLKVIEFNPIHCSGWYAVDVDKVLDNWTEWAKQEYNRKNKLKI